MSKSPLTRGVDAERAGCVKMGVVKIGLSDWGVKLMENKKKKAAAISAVMNYIKTEEEAVGMQPAIVTDSADFVSRRVSLNLWGISGRQAQMQMRSLMQMKAFHRIKL
ncbi:MAG: hypothetical protein ABIC39_02330 [Pseudomonadota bacterium]